MGPAAIASARGSEFPCGGFVDASSAFSRVSKPGSGNRSGGKHRWWLDLHHTGEWQKIEVSVVEKGAPGLGARAKIAAKPRAPYDTSIC